MPAQVTASSFDAASFKAQLAASLGLAADDVQLDVQPVNGTGVISVAAETAATASTTSALEQLQQLPADELRCALASPSARAL